MEYGCIGATFINRIRFADGQLKENILGGGTVFAYGGMLQFTPNAVLIAGRGTDFDESFGPWFKRNGLSEKGLVPFDNKTIVASMQYFPDGRWEETFEYGPGEGFRPVLYDRAEKLVDEHTKGLYICEPLTEKEPLERYRALRRNHPGFKSMFELITGDCRPELLETLEHDVLPYVDMYSLNKPESFSLFSVDTVEDAIARIQSLGVPCYYRVGKLGAYMISGNATAFCGPVHLCDAENEVDPTGCGNSSTAASLYAFCEGYSLAEIAAFGSVAAAYTVMQYGPNPAYSEQQRREAVQLALNTAKTIKTEVSEK